MFLPVAHRTRLQTISMLPNEHANTKHEELDENFDADVS